MNSTRCLSLAGDTAFPVDFYLACCPVCGGRLYVKAECWELDDRSVWRASDIDIDCESEPGLDDDEWDAWFAWHYDNSYPTWADIKERLLAAMQVLAFDLGD